MNQKNVEALEGLLRAANRDYIESVGGIAFWLASNGALVSASLSDTEAEVIKTCGVYLMGQTHEPGSPVAVRWALEHIAKGEPVPFVGEEGRLVSLHDDPDALTGD